MSAFDLSACPSALLLDSPQRPRRCVPLTFWWHDLLAHCKLCTRQTRPLQGPSWQVLLPSCKPGSLAHCSSLSHPSMW